MKNDDSLAAEFDRITAILDPEGYAQRSLEAETVPWLDMAARYLKDAIGRLPDFDCSCGDVKGDQRSCQITFIGSEKIIPVLNINFRISGNQIVAWAAVPDEGTLRLAGNPHPTCSLSEINEEWIEAVLKRFLVLLSV